MATLVTGGMVFVGSSIVRKLTQRGHKVDSVDIAEPLSSSFLTKRFQVNLTAYEVYSTKQRI